MYSLCCKTLSSMGLICLLLASTGWTEEVDKPETVWSASRDLIWSASDGLRREIFFSSLINQKWTEPFQVTYDNADNLTPSIDRTSRGMRYAVWAAVDQTGHIIRYAVSEKGGWSEARTIPELPWTATTPFISVGPDDDIWVVFAGNNGDSDDIYYTRLAGTAWTKPERVHAENQVPDIQPYLEIDDTGRMLLTWEGYRGDRYRTLRSVWNGEGWGEEFLLEEDGDAESALEEPSTSEIPEFVEDRLHAFLRVYDR
ncbi:hypothetical protein [Desulfobulbus alkaliphilus]|uniref:hypothetical protein n=1 Tax=Desulfobulbus alkaliphilus TaxID=869814 RepID=UPI00196246B9|nr:hypothetical protein [Desulfobulbus alkaliphilus]MBM9538005.1 hypothetical protein [Desulfobulbus alkaliphilus]